MTDPITDAVNVSATSTLDAIKNLPRIRKEMAKQHPFQLPGTDVVVYIAPIDYPTRHRFMLKSLSLHSSTDEANVDATAEAVKWAEFTEEMKDSYIIACVVEPELDVEALEAIGLFDANAKDKLFEEIQRVSGVINEQPLEDSSDAEDFTSDGEDTTS